MTVFFSVIAVILSISLIFLILMHSGKDSGLSGAFGVGTGQGSLGGGSLVERNLNRWTFLLAFIWVLDILLLVKKPWE
jgi:preprotein translocase subunit SecG